MTPKLSPMLATLNITKQEVKGDDLYVTMDDSTLLYELARFLHTGKRLEGQTQLMPYDTAIRMRRNREEWLLAIKDPKDNNFWTLRDPLQSIKDNLTPERYAFMAPVEWRPKVPGGIRVPDPKTDTDHEAT